MFNLRKRIERICASQEGIPDEDCPDLLSERYFWATTNTRLRESDSLETQARFSASVTPDQACLNAFGSITPHVAAPKAPMNPGVHADLIAHIRNEGWLCKLIWAHLG